MSFRGLFLFAALFLALMCAGQVVQPDPVRVSNRPDAFDANAAFARLERVLTPEEPHPVDSDGADRVRARLLVEIEALGLEPEVREQFSCLAHPTAPASLCGYVQNIVFAIGPASGPSILAATHYDSVPAGPGASDAGIGIASWLEIARLLADAPLQRRVIFLISDSEESGLLGAHAFATNDPRMQDVQAVVNLEARGTRGPASFFESGTPNADSVRAYAEGAARPMTNSMMTAVYELMPNATDVSLLKRPGLDIVNIAISDGWTHYHTPQDNLANLNHASLQHMGDSALGAVRSLAQSADVGDAETLVFTDILGRFLLHMPSWLSFALLTLSTLIALAYFWTRGPDQRWRVLAAPLLALFAAGLASLLIGAAFGALRPGMFWIAHPELTRAWTALVALAALAASFWLIAKRASAAHSEAAGMLWFGLMGVAFTAVLPGASIFFAAPMLLFAGAAGLAWRWSIAARVGAWVAALVALALWAPVFALLEVALGYAMPAATSVLIVVALLPWVGPLLRLQGKSSGTFAAAALSGAALVAVLLAALAPAFTPERQRALNVVYFQDFVANRAHFILGAAALPLPADMAQVAPFAANLALPGDRNPSWMAPASMLDAPPPRAEIVADRVIDGERTLRLRFVTEGAHFFGVRIPASADVSRAELNGVDATPLTQSSERANYWSLNCTGRACNGAEATLVLAEDAAPLDWLVVAQRLGVPSLADDLVAARPPYATPGQTGDATLTLARVTSAPQ